MTPEQSFAAWMRKEGTSLLNQLLTRHLSGGTDVTIAGELRDLLFLAYTEGGVQAHDDIDAIAASVAEKMRASHDS